MSQRQALTAGIDLGDRYTHVCLLDTENGEVIEESRWTMLVYPLV